MPVPFRNATQSRFFTELNTLQGLKREKKNMIDHSSKTHKRNPLLIRSAAILGSLSLLSSGIVLAQTDALVDPVSAPSAPAPAPAPRVSAPAPKKAVPAPTPRVSAPAPAPRVSAPAPRVSAPAPAPRVSAPAPKPEFSPTPRATSPQPTQPQLSAPNVSVPSNSRKIPQNLIDTPRQQPTPVISDKVKLSGSGPNTFVDNLGSSVVLTERSTGCKTVSRNGRLAQGRCGNTAGRSPRQRSTTVSASPVQRRSQSKLQTRRTNAANRSRVRPVAVRGRSAIQSIPAEQIAFYNQMKRQVVVPGGNTSLQFPLSIPAEITSSFGFRIHPILGTRRLHSGTDIAAPMGTPVLAAYGGEVAIADYTGGYGLMVALRHEDGTQESRYAHLSQVFVQPGDRVDRGDVIGLVGSTGMSTGPHLHFEWRHLMPSGWSAVDAGVHLEYAMQNLINGMNGVANLQRAEPHIEIGLDFQPDTQIAAKSAEKSPETQGISRGK